MKIYTKGGDQGKTSLVSGVRIDKSDLLIEAYGTVDELNAFIGNLMSYDHLPVEYFEMLRDIQNDLFNMGSVLAKGAFKSDDYPSIEEGDIKKIEDHIDQMNTNIKPLTEFILPSGSEGVSRAHICRTVCRRAERRVAALLTDLQEYHTSLKYLNRLSDYFFVFARVLANVEGIDEIRWKKRK